MRAYQAQSACAVCGQTTSADAEFCAWCGAPLADPVSAADPTANAVGGKPVDSASRDLPGSLQEVRERLQGEVRQKLHGMMPEVSSAIAESMTRLSGLTRYSQKPMILPPGPLRLQRTRWGAIAPRPLPPAPAVPMPARVLYVAFAGIWLAPLWIVATWLLILSMSGMPLARRMLDLAPTVLTLRPVQLAAGPWVSGVVGTCAPRAGWPARAYYFVLIGWWASLLWLTLAVCLSLTGAGRRMGYGMFEQGPTVAYLERR